MRATAEAIEVVLSYAEREVFHSRSGTNGVVQEDVEGVVAVAFTHWDSRAGDPQLHDHVVVANRARSVSDGKWRTLDSRGLFKSVVALSELHQGVLSDLLTEALGWGWDGRTRRHSERLRFEVEGVAEALMAEFSQRSVAIEERKNALVAEFATARGRQPTSTEVLDLRRRATLETRPAKEHRSLAEMTGRWRQRAEPYVGTDQRSWVAGLADRNDLPLLHAGDLADAILADAAGVAVQTVAERRATFSRANLLAEVHRQLHGVRFASPEDRIAVAERTTDLATAQSLLISGTRAAPHPRAPAPDRRNEPIPGEGPRDLHDGHPLGGREPAARRRTSDRRAGRRDGHRGDSDRGQPARSGPPAEPRPGPGGGADRHLGSFTRRPGRPGRDGQVHHDGRAPRRVGSRTRGGIGARAGTLGGSGRGLGRRARHRHGEHGEMALRAPPGGRAAEQAGGTSPRASVGRRIGAPPFAGATAHRRRRGRGGPLAAPERPTRHRGGSHLGGHLRSRRTGHARPATPGPRSSWSAIRPSSARSKRAACSPPWCATATGWPPS